MFDRFGGAQGFLFLQDRMVFNYWNLLNADKAKLWITNQVCIHVVISILEHIYIKYRSSEVFDEIKLISAQVKESWSDVPLHGNNIEWFVNQGDMIKKAVSNFPSQYQDNYRRSVGENNLIRCSSEIFYVPQRYTRDFSDLVKVIGSLDIHHSFAVPMLFLAIDSPSNFESKALTKLVYRADLPSDTTLSTIYTTEAHAVYPVKVQNEMDFVKLIRAMALGDPFLMELI